MALSDIVQLHSAAATLPADPTSWGDVSSWWKRPLPRAFTLGIWADVAAGLTVAKLVGAQARSVVIADDNVDAVNSLVFNDLTVSGVDVTDNELDFAGAHNLLTGDGPVRLTNSGGALPAGLAVATDYYVIARDADSIALATSRANALAGTAIDITGAGTGTHTVVDTATTQRDSLNTLTITGHAYKTGDGPVRLTTSGALPTGLATGVDYWIAVIDANTVKLFASRAALLAAGSVSGAGAVDIGVDSGSGTHTIVDVQGNPTGNTERLHWFDVEDVHGTTLLGIAGDGALTLTTTRGGAHRFEHLRRTLAYALVATVGSGSVSADVVLEEG